MCPKREVKGRETSSGASKESPRDGCAPSLELDWEGKTEVEMGYREGASDLRQLGEGGE